MTRAAAVRAAFRRLLPVVAIVASAALTSAALAAEAPVPVIAAAANLQHALPEIVRAFEAAGGGPVRIAFGASGNLARQIVAGAPFELLIAADQSTPQAVIAAGRAAGPAAVYAIGRLGLFVPAGSKIAPDAELAGLADAVRRGEVRRVVIANPALAPYGRAAREVLEGHGLWAPLAGRIALGENVNQAAQLALAGGVDAALLPVSLTSIAPLAGRGRAVTIDAARHRPIVQAMVLVSGAGERARRLHAFMLGREARAVLARYGFAAPD